MTKPSPEDDPRFFWPPVKERFDLTAYVRSRFKGLLRAHVLEVALERTTDGELWVFTKLRARGGSTKVVRHRNYLAGLQDAPLHKCVREYVEMDTHGWLMVTDIVRRRVARPIARMHEAIHAGWRGDPLPEEEDEPSALRRLQLERARRGKKKPTPAPEVGDKDEDEDEDEDGIPF